MSDPLSLRMGRDFPAGSVLFREGEHGEEMYVWSSSGLIQILKKIGNDMRPLATLGRGEFIGEMAILNSKPRVGDGRRARERALSRPRRGDPRADGREQRRDRGSPRQEARAPPRRGRRAHSDPPSPRPQRPRPSRAEAARRNVRPGRRRTGLDSTSVDGSAGPRGGGRCRSGAGRDVTPAPPQDRR